MNDAPARTPDASVIAREWRTANLADTKYFKCNRVFLYRASEARAVTLNGSEQCLGRYGRFPSSFHVHLSALFIHHFGNAMISLKK